jgi:hypothetical protein
VLVAALGVGSSATAAGAKARRDLCSQPALRVQFWPRGTPGNPTPHLVVYPGAHGRTRQQDRIGNADARFIDEEVCGRPSDFSDRLRKMRRPVRISSATQLVCRPGRTRALGALKSTPRTDTPHDGVVQLRGADRRAFYAILSPTELNPDGLPVLQYDRDLCTGHRIKCKGSSPRCRLSATARGGAESQRATLELRPVLAILPPTTASEASGAIEGNDVLASAPGAGDVRYQVGSVAMTEAGVRDARARNIPGIGWVVQLALTRRGIEVMNELARRQALLVPPQNSVAIVIDGMVQSAPAFVTDSFEGGDVEINGNFSEAQAKALAVSLRDRS